jgi:hypothetical protein
VYVLSFCPRFRVPETRNEKIPQSRDICAARVVSKLICYLDLCARRLFFSSLLKSRHIHFLCSLFACAAPSFHRIKKTHTHTHTHTHTTCHSLCFSKRWRWKNICVRCHFFILFWEAAHENWTGPNSMSGERTLNRNDRDHKFMCFLGFLKSESRGEMCARCLLGLGNVT